MIAALLLAVMAQTGTPQRDVRPPAPAATGTIAGVVTSADPQPSPLRRARVTLNGSALPLPRTIITADDGVFLFERVPVGEYTVAAAKDGYIGADIRATRPGRGPMPVAIGAGQTVRVGIALPRGAVITGTVTDVDGLPAQGILVTALARRFIAVGSQPDYRYVAAGVSAGPSDDRGVYRIYGLPPGDYVVAAQPQPRLMAFASGDVRLIVDGAVSPRPLLMSRVFHPGATSVAAAARIAVRAGEERSGVDVPLQYVPLAEISGAVALSTGGTAPNLTLTRMDEQAGFDPVRNSRVQPDGRFTFSGVPPGQYRIMGIIVPATGRRMYVASEIAVDGEDQTSVALSPQPMLTISGRLVFEGEHAPAVLPERIPVPLAMTLANSGFAAPPVRIEGDRFVAEGIIPGTYRLAGSMRGMRSPIGIWWLKSLVIGGRDVLDAPLDLRENAEDAVATFTDRVSELSGTVADAQGKAATDGWVIAAAPDRAAWFYTSRRIAAVRPERDGRYTFRNLPPGEYRVVSTRDIEDNEWFDPSVLERLLPSASTVTIRGAEKVTLNLERRR